jgi:hypothetical protein
MRIVHIESISNGLRGKLREHPNRGTNNVKLKPGDTVRVVGSRGTAKIRAILTSMHGALLEKLIDGFRRWNLDELRLVKRR